MLPRSARDVEDDGEFHFVVLGPKAASESGKPSAEAARYLDETTGQDRPFVRHGVDWVFELDVDAERSALGEMTRRRLGAPPPVAVLKVISQRTRGRQIAGVALWCVRNGFLDSSCEDVADRFGHDRKTLYRWARSELSCSVADLLRLGRQEHAHELLSAGLSFTQAAARLNYASASGIARLIGKRRNDPSGPTA